MVPLSLMDHASLGWSPSVCVCLLSLPHKLPTGFNRGTFIIVSPTVCCTEIVSHCQWLDHEYILFGMVLQDKPINISKFQQHW